MRCGGQTVAVTAYHPIKFQIMNIRTLQINGRPMDCYYYSNSQLKKPGIIFLHDLTGLQKANFKAAEILMEEGYHVLVPDLYSNIGLQKYCVRMLFDAVSRNNEAQKNQPLNEVMEVLDHFKAFKEVDENNIGMVGQCLTGGFILHAAIRPEVKAPVVFHHSFGRKGSGMPKKCSSLVKNTIQGHFVYADPFCPSGRIKQLEMELGDKLEKHMYMLPHGIPHLFFNNAQGKKAFKRMVHFFEEKLQQ